MKRIAVHADNAPTGKESNTWRGTTGLHPSLMALVVFLGLFLGQALGSASPSGVVIVRPVAPPIVRPAPRVSSAPKSGGSAKTNGQTKANNSGAKNGQKNQKGPASAKPGSKPAVSGRIAAVRPAGVPNKAQTVAGPGGSTIYTGLGGRQWQVDGANRVTQFSKPGMNANFTADGRITTASVTRSNGSTIQINHVDGGVRTVSIVRPKGVSVVSLGAQTGYVQRPNGSGLVARTYVSGGGPSVAVYQPAVYRGVTYYTYVPTFYYTPAFYGWAYNPWLAPAAFAWAWQGDPWYAFSAGYFTPARYYPSAALWVTDFLLAQDLMLSYRNQFAQTSGQYSGAMSTEIKSMIADEVKQEFAAAQASAVQGSGSARNVEVPPALSPDQKLFVVSSDLQVTVAGRTCVLTPGDTILRDDARMYDAGKVGALVMSSKSGDCPANSSTSVEIAALQEMHNQFRRQIDAGLAELARQQGHGGLPALDAAALATSPGPAGKVRPDSNVENELRQGLNEADKVEAEILRASNGRK
jgi:hypothetical protein